MRPQEIQNSKFKIQNAQTRSLTALSWLLLLPLSLPIWNVTCLIFNSPASAQTNPDRKAEADRLIQQGNQQLNTSQYRAALQSYQQALKIYRAIQNHNGEANALMNLGSAYGSLSQYQQEIEYYQQALAIFRQVNDRNGEAKALGNLGVAYGSLSQYQQEIEYYQQALAIFRQVNDRNGEAKALNNLGTAYASLSQYNKAIEYYQQALPIYRQVGDRNGEAKALNNLGGAYGSLSQYQRAIEYYEQALAIFRQVGDRSGEAKALTNLGGAYGSLSQYQRAIESYQQALAIFRQVSDRNGEAKALNNLGGAYGSLSQYQRAIESYQQALAIFRQVGDRNGEAAVLTNLGGAYGSLSQYQRAIESYEQALAIFRQVGDRNGEAAVLTNLGSAYRSLSQYNKAIEFYQQALPILHQVGDRNGEAKALGNLGLAYASLSQYSKAIEFYQQALPIFRQVGDRAGEGQLLSNLGYLLVAQKQPEQAIALYKQSVNVRETIREGIQNLSRQSQESYTQSVSGTYRNLAALLMQQGRLSEAQQVLELLKLRELKDFDRSTQPNPETLELPLTPAEQSLVAQVQQSPTKALSATLAQRPEKSDSLSERLRQRLNPANELNRSAQTLLTAQPNAALIYYLVHTDKLWILLVTPDGNLQAIPVPVTAQDLAKSVTEFRTRMEQCERRQCDKSDTASINAVSQTLYRWLFPAQLQQAVRSHSTQHLIFALDRMTRYLPVATLHDGQQYLIEQYAISNIIAAQLTDSRDRLTPKTTSVLGMGLSNPAEVTVPSLGTNHRDRFDGLSHVPAELGAIVASNGSRGVYPGLQFLNSTFTLDTLRKHLPNHRILHLATHGIFRAESLDASYLLLGTGKPLTIPEIDSNSLPSFANVHLIVLSACQTALGGRNQDGVEISGMTNAFLNKGSKAVMSSLWQVDDASTSVLMQQFYKNLSTGTMTKSAALKQAQLSLLQGKLTAKDAPNRAEANVEVKLKPGTQTAVRSTDFSHPYYWAPFILIGNGL